MIIRFQISLILPKLNIWHDIEKINIHEGRTVKALFDSRATGVFMSKNLAQKGGYRLIKLD